MKAAIWTGIEKIELGERPVPSAGEGEVLIRVKAAGICGTDLTIYHGKFPKERAKAPMVLGHEFCGTVEGVGRGVKDLEAGDLVVVDPLISCGSCYCCVEGYPHVCSNLKLLGVDVDGSFAEYVTAKAGRTHRLPRGFGVEQGAMVEPLSVAVHAVRRSSMNVGDTVLVTGGGPIGILIALVAASAGARTLVVSEIQDFRLGLLERLGLRGFNPLLADVRKLAAEWFGGVGPDIVFEVTGSAAGMQQAIESVRHMGTVVEVGLPKDRTENDTRRVVFGEISIVGSRVYAPVDIKTSIKLLEHRKVDVAPLVKTFAIEECPGLFSRLSRGEGNLMKAVMIVDSHS